MTITATQLKEIRQEFATLKPASVTLEGNRAMSVKEAVFALAPTLERMRKRGFDTQEIVERLAEKGIAIKPPTLTKYLKEYRRQKEDRKGRKKDTPPPPPCPPRLFRCVSTAGGAVKEEFTCFRPWSGALHAPERDAEPGTG